VNRTQDNLRYQLADARGAQNYTDTLSLSLGLEGELPSGNDRWDVTISTGRTDAQNTLTGSVRLTTYRQIMASPNFGVGFVGDPNPASVSFAEGIPTCVGHSDHARLRSVAGLHRDAALPATEPDARGSKHPGSQSVGDLPRNAGGRLGVCRRQATVRTLHLPPGQSDQNGSCAETVASVPEHGQRRRDST
jgi:hypothetical protein